MISIATLTSPALLAQTLDDVFDDGVQVDARNIIRTNLIAIYRGEPTLSYERLLNNQRAGLEVGLGLGMGKFRQGLLIDLLGPLEYDLSDAQTNSIFVNARFYDNGINRTGYFFKLGLRNQGFQFDDPAYNSFRYTDLLAGGGLHLLTFDRVTIDVFGDLLYRFMGENALTEIQKRDPYRMEGFDILVQLGLEVGFLF